MSALAAFAQDAATGWAITAAVCVAGFGVLCFAGRKRSPNRLERLLAHAELEDAMIRAQRKGQDGSDEGGDREPA
jgi:hypothetical protein